MTEKMTTHLKISSVKNKKALFRGEEISEAFCSFFKTTIQAFVIDGLKQSGLTILQMLLKRFKISYGIISIKTNF